jgi:hypothetical protein
MTIAVANQTVEKDDQRIRDRETQREALRARLFGAQTEPAAPKALIAALETEVRHLDAEIRELKASREAAALAESRPEIGL